MARYQAFFFIYGGGEGQDIFNQATGGKGGGRHLRRFKSPLFFLCVYFGLDFRFFKIWLG